MTVLLAGARSADLGPATPTGALLERYHRERDPQVREELTKRFLPLALSLSRRYHSLSEREDLDQVASLALLKALDRFDPTRGSAFSTFAVPTIVGELKRYFRDCGWMVRVPRSLQELAARVDAATEQLTRQLGRPPTVAEIARSCETTSESVLEGHAAASAHFPDSLDTPLRDATEAMTRIDTIPSEDAGYVRAEHAADLDRLLAGLPAREAAILRMRFHEDMTQAQIAERVGLSQMHVSRLIRNAIDELGRSVHPPVGSAEPR
jgi:RNA polymerase sigma-B factor